MISLITPWISAFTAGVVLILQTVLMFAAADQRRRTGEAHGEGGSPAVMRAVRRHGNLAENAAIFLIGIALFEMLGGPRLWVEGLCVVFVLARISHAVALSMERTVNPFRIVGVVATVLVGLALGVRLILIALPHLGG